MARTVPHRLQRPYLQHLGELGGRVAIEWRYRRRSPNPVPSERRRLLAEEAGSELTDVRAIIDGLWLGLLQHGRTYFSRAEAEAGKQRLRAAGEEINRRRSRLRVAFGTDSGVAEAFGIAADAVVETYRALGAIRNLHSDPPIRGDEFAQRQVDGYFAADRDRVREARLRFGDATERFEVAAGAWTGET